MSPPQGFRKSSPEIGWLAFRYRDFGPRLSSNLSNGLTIFYLGGAEAFPGGGAGKILRRIEEGNLFGGGGEVER